MLVWDYHLNLKVLWLKSLKMITFKQRLCKNHWGYQNASSVFQSPTFYELFWMVLLLWGTLEPCFTKTPRSSPGGGSLVRLCLCRVMLTGWTNRKSQEKKPHKLLSWWVLPLICCGTSAITESVSVYMWIYCPLLSTDINIRQKTANYKWVRICSLTHSHRASRWQSSRLFLVQMCCPWCP